MSAAPVPLAKLSLVYTRHDHRPDRGLAIRRGLLWGGALLVALAIYLGVHAFFAWKHVVSASGGLYFTHRVELTVPVFSQDDPRWTFELLGPTFDTLGQAGCAVTSAAMVLSAYGVDTDPGRLNQYLMAHGGYTEQGWLYWEKAADLAPGGQVEKAYEDLPSYALIDQNLLAATRSSSACACTTARPTSSSSSASRAGITSSRTRRASRPTASIRSRN